MKLSGTPEVIMDSPYKALFETVGSILGGWESVVQSLPELPETSADSLSQPMDLFLHQQVEYI